MFLQEDSSSTIVMLRSSVVTKYLGDDTTEEAIHRSEAKNEQSLIILSIWCGEIGPNMKL